MTATNVIALHQDEPTPEELREMRAMAMKFVIRIRRNVREIILRREQLSGASRGHARAARLMRESGNPFDQHRIGVREFRAELLRKSSRDCRQLLQDYGRLLIDTAPLIDQTLTLAERCDLLNINRADRAGLTEEDGIVQLAYLRGLEDSVEHRGHDFKNGPLFNAMMLVFIDFLCNHAEGKKLGDSLFKPGGLFAGVPKYRQLPDGSMERMPPRLEVVGDSIPPEQRAGSLAMQGVPNDR